MNVSPSSPSAGKPAIPKVFLNLDRTLYNHLDGLLTPAYGTADCLWATLTVLSVSA